MKTIRVRAELGSVEMWVSLLTEVHRPPFDKAGVWYVSLCGYVGSHEDRMCEIVLSRTERSSVALIDGVRYRQVY